MNLLSRIVISASLLGLALPAYSSVVLDSFEQAEIRISNPSGTDIKKQLLWSQYPGDPTEGPDHGTESISSIDSYEGNNSLEITVDSGNTYLQFYSKVNSTTWEWARSFVTEDWQFNKYNRLRFWVKLPPGITKYSGGTSNTRFGTYYRKSTGKKDSAESGGNHYYHYYNLESTGQWHQIIVDWHPNNIRGQSGGTDWGQKEHPSGETDYNYFDLLTRFYFEINGSLPNYPSKFYFDHFEFYEEKNVENLDQIYAINGVYNPETNNIIIGWMRHKDENKIGHEVRYSFSDIHASGWENAIQAPNGIIYPEGWQGYNAMDYKTDKIDVSGKSQIYIAIKPTNILLFRQITIPISGEPILPSDSPPEPPSSINLQINP